MNKQMVGKVLNCSVSWFKYFRTTGWWQYTTSFNYFSLKAHPFNLFCLAFFLSPAYSDLAFLQQLQWDSQHPPLFCSRQEHRQQAKSQRGEVFQMSLITFLRLLPFIDAGFRNLFALWLFYFVPRMPVWGWSGSFVKRSIDWRACCWASLW